MAKGTKPRTTAAQNRAAKLKQLTAAGKGRSAQAAALRGPRGKGAKAGKKVQGRKGSTAKTSSE